MPLEEDNGGEKGDIMPFQLAWMSDTQQGKSQEAQSVRAGVPRVKERQKTREDFSPSGFLQRVREVRPGRPIAGLTADIPDI